MKQIQRETSINTLAVSLGNMQQAMSLISRERIEAAVTAACEKVLIDCYMRGGRVGARHVKEVTQ